MNLRPKAYESYPDQSAYNAHLPTPFIFRVFVHHPIFPSMSILAKPECGTEFETSPKLVVITLPRFFPIESECIVCGAPLFDCKQGIPMYEGEPVTHDYGGEWAGFDACKACFDGYEANAKNESRLAAWFENKRQQRESRP